MNPMDFWQGITTLLDKYGVEAVTLIISLAILFRTVPGAIKAIVDILRTRAEASAKTQTTEAQNDAKVLDILQQQVNNSATTNTILMQYQAEFAQYREAITRGVQINERLEVAIRGFNDETNALRKDLKNWPHTVDGTLAGLITTVDTLRVKFEATSQTADSDHKKVLDMLTDIQFKVGVIYRLATRQPDPPEPPTPPTEPDSGTPSRTQARQTNADGAQHSAIVDLPVVKPADSEGKEKPAA